MLDFVIICRVWARESGLEVSRRDVWVELFWEKSAAAAAMWRLKAESML